MKTAEHSHSSLSTDPWTMFRVHRAKFIWALSIVVGASMLIAFTMPPVYRSTATILVEGQEIPLAMVKTTVSGFIEARLAAVEKQVLSDKNLLEIAERYELYPEFRGQGYEPELIKYMRGDVTRDMSSIETTNPRNGRPMVATIAFSVSFDAGDPQVAQKVADELANLFLLENRKIRSEKAATVSMFLADEADKLEKQIQAIESSLSEFKQENVSALPESADMTRKLLERAEETLVTLDQSIISNQAQLQTYQKQLQDKSYLHGAYSEADGRLLTGTELLLVEKAKLAEAETRYSQYHPDVINLKKEIAILESQLQGTGGQQMPDSSSYNQEGISLAVKVANLKGSINADRQAKAAIQDKIADYEARLLRMPIVEREYQKLNRALDNAINNHRDIKTRQVEAELAERLEREDKSEKLAIVKPASYPGSVYRPNRIGIVLFGFVLGVGIGVGVVAVAGYYDNRIHGVHAIRAVTGIPPIAVIPVVSNGDGSAVNKAVAWSVLLLLLCAAGMYIYGLNLSELLAR